MAVADLPLVAVAGMLAIGVYGLLFERNLIKIAVAVSVMESGVNLLLVALGYRQGGTAPIYTMAPEGAAMVLPTPQALTLTAIVIGLATTAFLLALIVVLCRHYGTLDVREIRRLRG
ncbi:MAG: sodium:proton antiporter [Moorellales bacterium]